MPLVRLNGIISTIGSPMEDDELESSVPVVAPPAEVISESGGGDGGVEAAAVDNRRVSGRRRTGSRVRVVEDDEPEIDPELEIDPEPDLEDDCAVYGDDDCDVVDDAVAGEGNEDNVVEEDANLNIADDFPEAYRADEEAGSDSDTGDDIWDDEKIPDPLSSDDEDEVVRVGEEAVCGDEDDPEVLLAIEKTFNSPDDFKRAVLMYSLKTRYNIKLYRSESLMVAAKCCYVNELGVNCPWRVLCSYEKKKHKMQIRIYFNEHICVRSGYTKMLKRSTIAALFEERLRVNPKMTKYEMVAEIKREYKLEVTPDQCAKAKTKVLKARNASHDTHFSRIWDYQAEVSWKQHCRPVIGIDGAFLKWDIKGHLLAAVGRDGDNRIVPLAWAVEPQGAQSYQEQAVSGHGSQEQAASGHGSQGHGSQRHGSQEQAASGHGSQGHGSQGSRAHGPQRQRASQRQRSRAHETNVTLDHVVRLTVSFTGTWVSYITFLAKESEDDDTLVEYQAKVAKKLRRKSYPMVYWPRNSTFPSTSHNMPFSNSL
ncbi:Transposase MuDR plant [Arabidopsis suecica]|uniref:Transposase MuDR plant n=1 Tax=Arabidopsis suecica TaxID=45249 RepID=A0A8T2BXI0_ARASU|nr:Transposase MuDR plant [Arabidopsis suecica]